VPKKKATSRQATPQAPFNGLRSAYAQPYQRLRPKKKFSAAR
jgi:hypothetical protein